MVRRLFEAVITRQRCQKKKKKSDRLNVRDRNDGKRTRDKVRTQSYCTRGLYIT